MTPAELLSRFRSDMADTVAPYFWTDADAWSYFDEAQSMFVRLTGGLADSSSAITQLVIEANTEWYPISPKILKIRKAIRKDSGYPIDIISPETAWDFGMRFDGAVGPFKVLVQGAEDSKLRAYPVPNNVVDINVELQVLRLPLTSITSGSSVLEVPEQHHIHLLLWAKSRAYMKQDAETFDKTKASEFEDSFRIYCNGVERELSRQRRNAGTTTYGGL